MSQNEEQLYCIHVYFQRYILPAGVYFLWYILPAGVYDARVRVVVEHMSWMLRVDMKSVEFIEDHLIEILRNHGELSE